jgi:hypothetical protein
MGREVCSSRPGLYSDTEVIPFLAVLVLIRDTGVGVEKVTEISR